MPIQPNCLCAFDPDIQATAIHLTNDLNSLALQERTWATASGVTGKAGDILLIPSAEGALQKVYVFTQDTLDEHTAKDPWLLAGLPSKLPNGIYTIAQDTQKINQEHIALGWALAHYNFDRYKSQASSKDCTLMLDQHTNIKAIRNSADAVATVRDLVNTPAEDMGPADLQDIIEALAEQHNAQVSTIVGEDLLDENFPAIHAVGRAAEHGREPRLIELNWQPLAANDGINNPNLPKLTLIGKGICFDTGGLDLKPSSAMLLMKKDMGGAAHAIGLAGLIMAQGLGVNLRLLVPAAENAVAGNAFRPGDVLPTRQGISVEVGNTDAEGRLVLCDALTYGSEENPDLMIDFATLTGAARVALGPDLPATYTNNETMWNALEAASRFVRDPLWRMPLWDGYENDLSSDIADINNISAGPFAGSITAALYLRKFINDTPAWVHFDTFAWSPKAKAGRPKGGEAQGLRAAYHAIQKYFGI